MRISDWSSDVCSSDLLALEVSAAARTGGMSASLHVDQLALSIAGRLVRKNGGDRQAETTRHGFGRHRLRVVTDYVEDALEMGLSLKDLSNLAAMSVTHFTRQFRAEMRSEEPTSELQSLMRISYAVFCLKKKNKIHTPARTARVPTCI